MAICDPQTQRQLLAASGFMELGMFQEAVEELESLPEAIREIPIVLAVWLEVYQGWKKWAEAISVATRLVEAQPYEPNWRVAQAYAIRRARGISFAREVLNEAKQKFPDSALIHFNLGCYAAQLGELDEARERIESAIRLDQQFEALSKTDPDLAPLRDQSDGQSRNN